MIMMDIEGAEVDALRGMKQAIERHRPLILCEVHWILEEFTGYCETVLRPLGYNISTLTGEEFPKVPARYHAVMIPGERMHK